MRNVSRERLRENVALHLVGVSFERGSAGAPRARVPAHAPTARPVSVSVRPSSPSLSSLRAAASHSARTLGRALLAAQASGAGHGADDGGRFTHPR